jgi:ATP-dependent Lon protease
MDPLHPLFSATDSSQENTPGDTQVTGPTIQMNMNPTSGEKQSNDQVRKLGERIEQANLPSELKANLLERISRLALIRASSGFMSTNYILEYENTSTYLNWVLGLPWDTQSEDLLDLVAAKQILDKNHYGLDVIKDRILEYLATIILNLKEGKKDTIARAPILCLVGLAGTGKTTLAISIAEALGRKFSRIPFGGMADSRVLRGQSKAFPDAEPGSVIKKLVGAKTKNPVILLDELDRVSDDSRADIMGVLIELLDPEQNFSFTDHYIDYPFDLSRVLFVATANNTKNISTAVLDRLEIIQMPSYTDQEKTTIAKQYLFNRIKQNTGLNDTQIQIDDTVWPLLIRPLGFDSGIRSLERLIEGMCRKVARMIVEGKATSVKIDQTNIKEFLPQW